MKRRTYTIPIVITLAMIACVVFLITVFLQSPYEKAIRNGDKAMENYNYIRAVSEYTIAQNVDSDRLEAYEKGLNALVLLNSNTVARDFLSTINSCIEFCGTKSISDKQIIDAIDILVTLGNAKAACEILEHLHQSYSGSELIKEKIKTLNLEIYQDTPYSASEESTPADSPAPQIQPKSELQPAEPTEANTQTPYGDASTENNITNGEPEPTVQSTATPQPSEMPQSPSQTTAPVSSPAPAQAPAQPQPQAPVSNDTQTQQGAE